VWHVPSINVGIAVVVVVVAAAAATTTTKLNGHVVVRIICWISKQSKFFTERLFADAPSIPRA
jgi:uncharacterized membrane protein